MQRSHDAPHYMDKNAQNLYNALRIAIPFVKSKEGRISPKLVRLFLLPVLPGSGGESYAQANGCPKSGAT